MVAGRLKKRISRALMVSWREQPTRYDIEALQANIRRVGLVVRVRWVLVAVLIAYSIVAGLMYTARIPVSELARLMLAPALALGFVLLYNTFYSLNYRRLGSIAVWNNLQLALDALVVTVLVYFSGGSNSWFWSMYSLFILEAAFILPRSRTVWGTALLCAGLLGGIELGELLGVLPHVQIPFASSEFYNDPVFVTVRYLWQVAVLVGTAGVATLLVGEYRRELSARGTQMLDSQTGLYSRGYFLRALSAEVRRQSRTSRPLHVLLFDIDRFGAYNDRFGLDAGDELLAGIARTIGDAVRQGGDAMQTINVAGRFGGEEFVVLLAEDVSSGDEIGCDGALVFAERVRRAVEGVRVHGAGVTVSAGIASSPDDGMTADELLDAADAALSSAIQAGGNSVITASQCVRAPILDQDGGA